MAGLKRKPAASLADPRRLAIFDEKAAQEFIESRGDAWDGNVTSCRVAGIDEAGRGPLAGPVVAAAVLLPPGLCIEGLDDSKKLPAPTRESLFEIIRQRALACGVGIVDAETIDRINILEATRLAARRALDALGVAPDLVMLDALRLDGMRVAQRSIIKGDAQSQCIAAASVVAKVTRDRLMVRYDAEYPEYGFASHKGYGAASHLDALRRLGPSTLHRLTFRGVCFFDPVCRRSRTCHTLDAALKAASSATERHRLRGEIESFRGFLPDREISALLAQCAAP